MYSTIHQTTHFRPADVPFVRTAGVPVVKANDVIWLESPGSSG